MIPTRKEFEKLFVDALRMEAELVYAIAHEIDVHEARQNLNEAGEKVIAVYDTMAARIADQDTELNKFTEVLAERGCDGIVHECAALEERIAELEEESATWEKSSVAALVARRAEQDRRISMLETELGRACDIIDRAVQRSQHFQELAKTLGEQRDALLTACKDLVEIDRRDARWDPAEIATDEWRAKAWDNARAAIAKVHIYDYRQACADIYDENPILAAACNKEALEREEILHTAFGTQSARIAELEAVCKTLVTAEDSGDLAMVEKAARIARVALGKEMSSE